MKSTTYYIGMFNKELDDKFYVLATTKDSGAAIFIVRAYNQYNRDCKDLGVEYAMFPKDNLPEHWEYVKD